MPMSGQPVVKDVVLVGAGHAHVGVLPAFGMRPLPGVRFTLITRELDTPYSGMLPGLIAGHYEFEETYIDTGPLARFAGARLYHDVALGLDLERREVICRDRPPVPYDLLSLDIGSTPNTGAVPGAAEHAIPVKPIDGFLPRFQAMLGRVLACRGRCTVALVGAGPGGVEMLFSIERRLRSEVATAGLDPTGLRFVLVSGTGDILPTLPDGVRARTRRKFAERDVAVVAGARVTRVEPGLLRSHLLVAAGRRATFDGLGLDEADVEHTEKGIKVDDRLRTTNKRIFAIGDVTGGLQFTHAAGHHAGIVIRNALFRWPAKATPKSIPWVTYTDPELAQVGLTFTISRFPFAEIDRARAEHETDEFAKIVLGRRGKVLGATIVGRGAGELILPWVLAIDAGLGIGAMAGVVAPYPTFSEVSKRAAGVYYAPKLFSPLTRTIVGIVQRFG